LTKWDFSVGNYTEFLVVDESLRDLGLKPISSHAPAGESVRYELEFEELQAEIAKLESLKDESVDWEKVVSDSAQVLSSMSKDLLVACYLCHGLYETNGYAGLAAGLTVLRDMVSTYWDDLYPEQKRLRARISAVKWLVDRLGGSIPNKVPASDRHEAVVSSCELADEFERLLNEKLGERTPSGDQEPLWGELHRALREHDESISRAKAKHEQDPPPPTPPLQESASEGAKPAVTVATTPTAPVAPQEIGSEQDANKTLRVCKDMLKKLAKYQRERKLDDPQSYHLLRMAVWADIELPTTLNGTTQVRPPPEEKVANFSKLMEVGNYQELIQEVESSFAGAPFWLDLHRYVATALEALGYAEALRVVIDNLSLLLRRFPALPECKFVSGQTFADELTQVWVQTAVLSEEVQHDVSSFCPSKDVSSENAGWLEAGREAKSLAAKGEIRQAVKLFKEGRRLASTGREQFLWALQEARFWQETGHSEIAVAQIESLDDEAQRYNLEQWEPELSFQIAELLLVWYKRLETQGCLPPERAARKERMCSRVSRLDAVRAMDLLAKGK
jgi:type VI secretion system protein VasJ